jgi:signal transduction histidine kinase
VGFAVAWLAAAAFVTLTAGDVGTLALWPPARAIAAAGGALLLVVAFAWWVARQRSAAAVTLVVAIAWQIWMLSRSGSAAAELRGVGLYASALVVPGLGVLVTPRRWAPVWVVPVLAGLAWAAVYDPFRDTRCDTYCGTNELAFRTDPRLAARLLDVRVATAVGIAVAFAIVAWRKRRYPAAATLTALAGIALAPGLRAHGLDQPARVVGSVAVLALATLALVPLGLAVGRTRRLVRLRRLAAATAAGATTSLRDGLRTAVSDRSLEVAYACDDGSLVSADGAVHVSRAGNTATNLAVRGRTVAVIEHSSSVDPAELHDAFGSAARTAAWNEALEADLRHQLAEVTASRRRLLDAGDRERRRLERDLHDGVQQGLLGLLFELKRVERTAGDDARAALRRSATHVSAALAEVRSLANGIYPAVIDQAGLSAALHTLVELGSRPVTIESPEAPVPAAVAHTVHDVVAAVAGVGGTRPARVVARTDGDWLRVAVEAPGRAIPRALADRVASLGGTTAATDDAWEVSLPCAS